MLSSFLHVPFMLSAEVPPVVRYENPILFCSVVQMTSVCPAFFGISVPKLNGMDGIVPATPQRLGYWGPYALIQVECQSAHCRSAFRVRQIILLQISLHFVAVRACILEGAFDLIG